MQHGTRTAAAAQDELTRANPRGDSGRGRPPRRRAALLLAGALTLAALTGGGLYLSRGAAAPAPAAGLAATAARSAAAGCAAAGGSCAASPAGVAVAGTPVTATVPSRPATASAHPAKARPSSPVSSGSPSPARATPSVTMTSAQPSEPATALPTPSAAAAPTGGTAPDQGGTPAAQVLALINQARATAGLPALTLTAGLESSSSAHNLLMAGGCGLSHQCPGEPAIGQRETDAGVDWTAAGENIGEGGPVADTTAAIAAMGVGLTQSMLDEQPPDDGHRLNILSTTFTHIGIAVYRDSSGTVWLTQDFSN